MNTGFLGLAVATVLTVYGIETPLYSKCPAEFPSRLQQYLPFTVLKRYSAERERYTQELQQYLPFTVLKLKPSSCCLNKQPLQQYLPFTVLKRMDGKAGLIAELK